MGPLGKEMALVSRLSCFPKILHLFLKEQLNVNTWQRTFVISTLFTFDSCALYICNKKVGPDTPVTLFKKSCFDRKRRRMNSSSRAQTLGFYTHSQLGFTYFLDCNSGKWCNGFQDSWYGIIKNATSLHSTLSKYAPQTLHWRLNCFYLYYKWGKKEQMRRSLLTLNDQRPPLLSKKKFFQSLTAYVITQAGELRALFLLTGS